MGQTTEKVKSLLGGKLALERRNANPMLYARARVQGKQLVYRTGESRILSASKVAEDWYLSMLDRARKGEQIHGRTFADIAERFLTYADGKGEVSPLQRRNYRHKWNLLKSSFNGVKVTDIDEDWLDDLRNERAKTETRNGTVKPQTLKKDFDFIRLVLKHAIREQALHALPTFPSFKGDWTIVSEGRPFFDPADYKKLLKAAWKHMREPDLNPRVRYQRQEMYWMLHIMSGAALRVGEAHSLRWLDCNFGVLSDVDRTNVLHLKVFGKHSKKKGKREHAYGIGPALAAFYALLASRGMNGKTPEPDDTPIFKEHHRDGFRMLLEENGLREHTETGKTRDWKSLRPTGISQRLEATENPDFRDIAKWARTHPDQIFKFYDQTHPEDTVTRLVQKKRKRQA